MRIKPTKLASRWSDRAAEPKLHSVLQRYFVWGFVGLVAINGCATVPAPTAAPPPPVPAGTPTVVAVAPPSPPPVTLPQFLGLDVVGRAAVVGVRRVRLRLANRWPTLQPTAKTAPAPVGDPANLASPSPAVASAAAIQQAQADAPAKVQAFQFLGTVDCGQYPEAEQAFLSGFDDVSPVVRSAAVQALIDSQRVCGECNCSCGSCCTAAIRDRLLCMAYEKNDQACFCEPNAKVRRLARIALEACGGPQPSPVGPQVSEELPPPAVLELVHPLPN
ncbi:MAG: hypothetical protein AAGG44_06540 [Planctomycetota bacterium]